MAHATPRPDGRTPDTQTRENERRRSGHRRRPDRRGHGRARVNDAGRRGNDQLWRWRGLLGARYQRNYRPRIVGELAQIAELVLEMSLFLVAVVVGRLVLPNVYPSGKEADNRKPRDGLVPASPGQLQHARHAQHSAHIGHPSRVPAQALDAARTDAGLKPRARWSRDRHQLVVTIRLVRNPSSTKGRGVHVCRIHDAPRPRDPPGRCRPSDALRTRRHHPEDPRDRLSSAAGRSSFSKFAAVSV